MAWTYNIKTGELSLMGKLLAIGYAGADGVWKNNPDMIQVHQKGPLPPGAYEFQAPVDTDTHGPYVLWLTPSLANEMFGRSSFGMHGDSISNPGKASEGCIIMPRWARERVWESGDHDLEVIKGG